MIGVVRKTGLFLVAVVAFGLLLPGSMARPQQAAAVTCADNGLPCNVGYFSGQTVTGAQHNLYYGNDYTWGGSPFELGLRPSNVAELKNLIGVRLSCTNGGNPPTVMTNPGNQNATAAAFTVLTMLGVAPGASKNVACERFWEWAALMDAYDTAGLIHYSEWYAPNGVNTRLSYNQGTDVSYYTDWDPPSAPSVVFYDPNGSGPLYAIKRDCGNPLGRLRSLVWDYDLRPLITVTDSTGSTPSTVEPGETLTFTYYIRNWGSTGSPAVNCYGGKLPHAGYFPTPPTPESGGTPLILACPRVFGVSPANIYVGGPETVTATANTTICRTLFVNPTVHGGGARGTEVCIPVASRPYVIAFGGDVKTGGDVETAADTCALDNQASIATWNIHSAAAGYAGAGVQYAALATGLIKAFATAQGSPAGNPGMPSGLAFASTTQNHAAGSYGGGFGTATCIKNYYGSGAGSGALTLNPSESVSALGSGKYAGGNTTLNGGNINPGQKTQLYIDGDLYITGDIRYIGNWSFDQIPMFEVIVRGNIYVDNNVQRLDGVYIAQPRPDNSKGYIYTCTTGAAPPTLTAGAFYNSCVTDKLTVNGSFVSRDLQLLRTRGTLRDGVAGETKASNAAAESFNYGPGFWITQPAPSDSSSDGEADNYDAITSLPPVL